MQSRILFLGTAGDVSSVGKQMRKSGGILFKHNNTQFHIDPGPGALLMSKMVNMPSRETLAILATKNTLPRINDINAVIFAMTHNGLDRRGAVLCPSTVREGILRESAQHQLAPPEPVGAETPANSSSVGVMSET